MSTPTYLWLDGKVVPYAEAKIHVLTPAVTYGSTVFEGLRAYWNEGAPAAIHAHDAVRASL
jgi:branched-chain amino acid aminotransferase